MLQKLWKNYPIFVFELCGKPIRTVLDNSKAFLRELLNFYFHIKKTTEYEMFHSEKNAHCTVHNVIHQY